MITINDLIIMEEARCFRSNLMVSLMNQNDLTSEVLDEYCKTYGSVTLHDTSTPDFTPGRITLLTAAVFYKRWQTVWRILKIVPREHLNLNFKMPHPISQTKPEQTAIEMLMQTRNEETNLLYKGIITDICNEIFSYSGFSV